MSVIVVLGSVYSVPSQEIGLRKRLWNDLFCVEWDVKPQLNQCLRLSGVEHAAAVTELVCCVTGVLRPSAAGAHQLSRPHQQEISTTTHDRRWRHRPTQQTIAHTTDCFMSPCHLDQLRIGDGRPSWLLIKRAPARDGALKALRGE